MKEDNKKNDNYFEIKKIEMDEFKKVEKKQKAFLLRSDIAMAVFAVLTTSVAASRGHNPFIIFAELFTLPIGLLTLGNIKTLSILKRKKAQIDLKYDYLEKNSDVRKGK